jgi:hypothetical protein
MLQKGMRVREAIAEDLRENVGILLQVLTADA